PERRREESSTPCPASASTSPGTPPTWSPRLPPLSALVRRSSRSQRQSWRGAYAVVLTSTGAYRRRLLPTDYNLQVSALDNRSRAKAGALARHKFCACPVTGRQLTGAGISRAGGCIEVATSSAQQPTIATSTSNLRS